MILYIYDRSINYLKRDTMIAMSLHSVEPKKLETVANLDNAEETIILIYYAQLGDQIKMIHIVPSNQHLRVSKNLI